MTTAPGDAEARQMASIAALDQGGLPLAAQERVARSAEQGAGWTSDLSVAELTAIRHAGFEPVGMVMGSSVFRVAAQWGYAVGWVNVGGAYSEQFPCPHGYGYYAGGNEHYTGWNWEHTVHERGITAARDLALHRLTAECTALGAHGVVGAAVRLLRMAGAGNSYEFTVIATAVRRPGHAPLPRPFMSHVRGTEFGKLIHSGYVPSGLVIGIGAVEIDPGCGTEWATRSWANQELNQFSRGVEAARRLSVAHLERETGTADGDGCVGVEVQSAIHELSGTREARLVEMFCIGTAVRRFAREPMEQPPLPIMRLR